MSPKFDEETQALLDRMSPEISNLMVRMMSRRCQNWGQARALRDEIVELNKVAKTGEEQAAICFAFNALMDNVEADDLIDPSSLDQFRNVRKADYKMIVAQQAWIGENVDPARLEAVTRREVEAGRLDAHDGLRQLAIDAAAVMGKSVNAIKRPTWLERLFRKSA